MGSQVHCSSAQKDSGQTSIPCHKVLWLSRGLLSLSFMNLRWSFHRESSLAMCQLRSRCVTDQRRYRAQVFTNNIYLFQYTYKYFFPVLGLNGMYLILFLSFQEVALGNAKLDNEFWQCLASFLTSSWSAGCIYSFQSAQFFQVWRHQSVSKVDLIFHLHY